MATITPPKKNLDKKDNLVDKKIGVPPSKALAKPSPTESVNLNLTVPNSLKIEYKTFCAQQGRTMNSIFEEMFNEYKTKF